MPAAGNPLPPEPLSAFFFDEVFGAGLADASTMAEANPPEPAADWLESPLAALSWLATGWGGGVDRFGRMLFM